LLLQPAAIEVLLHGEGRAQQADPRQARRLDRRRRRVGDVQQRDLHRRVDGPGAAVHGVGAQHQEVGAALLQGLGGLGQLAGQGVPVAGVLQGLDPGEVERPHQAAGRGHAAQPVADALVDQPIVLGRAFPAHAADQAYESLARPWIVSLSVVCPERPSHRRRVFPLSLDTNLEKQKPGRPAMDTVIHNPTDGIYAATDDYVHALEVRNPARMLFVAGTMGLDAQGWRGRAWNTSWSWSGTTCGPSWPAPA
jgi:hypothetical protein